ncbi:hypothetical protein ASPWEDRAFT_160173 [Aspergillus wentii DTO 134E9]|uniref:FAD-binding PCMH-type domain-containing protein n=1 Tax=Aspergillus wentii DTO 134E9 TaxID=1073089 RepID=A0A1L9REU0_ASPWE|nr:uncharacterized protein ASPWEDRAFT_160173 [Aspergillus wentii DTO 134E9]KAI9933671.1 hypothetical protein MW887_008144 [Aspergillus wentii]OJJ33424.1 hypothetical protein ASPWEDRAFT_160173 [Aspergillus wentii DTO 134E9]
MKFCPSTVALLSAWPVSSASGIPESCCASLQASPLHTNLFYPNSLAYNQSVSSYFSVNAQLDPTCIVQPHTAEQVSLAVSTLSRNGSSPCKFAVRSGGHTIWAGAANIEPGVTIDLSMMNSTTYHKDTQTASILPGSRWQAVYKTLGKYNRTVAGGRGGTVGVGGFLIGGGNTFHTARVGFACDNVLNYQIVLGNGTIANANKHSNADLYKALKGGTINFGIVTRYDMATIEGDLLWGGVVTYDNSTTSQQIPAISNFIDNIHNDPYASYIGMWGYSSATGQNAITNAYEYTKPVARAPAFDEFLAIKNTSDTMHFGSMYNLTVDLVQASGTRNVFLTSTYFNNPKVMEKAVDIHNDLIEEAKKQVQSKSWSMVTMVQPWPTLFAELSAKKGGNVLGLERFDRNMFQTLFDYSWDNAADDALFNRLAQSITEQLNGYAKEIGEDNPYIYLNYADKTQNPLQGYGEVNVKYIANVAKKYDPAGVFQRQVPGGFKVTEA